MNVLVHGPREHRRPDGTHFTMRELAVLAEVDGEVRIRWLADYAKYGVEPMLPSVPAEPGWYLLLLLTYDDGSPDDVERFPVVAWQPGAGDSLYGASATIIAWDEGGHPSPVDAARYIEEGATRSLGFFHSERFPEDRDPDVAAALTPRSSGSAAEHADEAPA